ncbi:MAG: transcription termination/antitermination protein NusG [Verrucomicrobiota bacterium]|nr:transcription termination/antitermination protein NusG [Verrucomicrobiota bacterium]
MQNEENMDKWYIVHVMSGKENRVKESIEKKAELEEMNQYIHELLIPAEIVSEVKKGKKTMQQRKVFPGYMMMCLDLYDQEGNFNAKLWHYINGTNNVISFLGGDKPSPLDPKEVKEILGQLTEDEEVVKPKVDFEVGETVIIKEGAFTNLEGNIEMVDIEKGKLRVMLSIFGRSTPAELEYWQVEKI